MSEVIAGNLEGIRDNGERWSRKSNGMVHNFWNHKYVVDRLRWTAENYGIKLTLINERGTSSRCPWCGSRDVTKRGRLFKCRACSVEAHRDTVGAKNIGIVHDGGCVNRVMAHPLIAKPPHQQNGYQEGIPAL